MADPGEGSSTSWPFDSASYGRGQAAGLRRMGTAIARQKKRKAAAKTRQLKAEARLRLLQEEGAEGTIIVLATREHAEATAWVHATSQCLQNLRQQRRGLIVTSRMASERFVPLRNIDTGAEGMLLRFQKLGIPIDPQEMVIPWHTRRQFSRLRKHVGLECDTDASAQASPIEPCVTLPATSLSTHGPAPGSVRNTVITGTAEPIEHEASSCTDGTKVCTETAWREPSLPGPDPSTVRTSPPANSAPQFALLAVGSGSAINEEGNLLEPLPALGDQSAISGTVTGLVRAPLHLAGTARPGDVKPAVSSSVPGSSAPSSKTPLIGRYTPWSFDAGRAEPTHRRASDELTRGPSHTRELESESEPCSAAPREPTARSAEGLVKPDLSATGTPTSDAVLQSGMSPFPESQWGMPFQAATCGSRRASLAGRCNISVSNVRAIGVLEQAAGPRPTASSPSGVEGLSVAGGNELELPPEARAPLQTIAEADCGGNKRIRFKRGPSPDASQGVVISVATAGPGHVGREVASAVVTSQAPALPQAPEEQPPEHKWHWRLPHSGPAQGEGKLGKRNCPR
ncbi:hypothetical protein BESB_028560 [Besnoitia besnoiti]|uniref:Uncharacterized protein n=1 Tax=Besnoitia besnoiti TaxID=94643 RepID=A0A2A9M542_BESBE|nr:uncharacterized protein BESB_028560 [Besnoitia besnoiti]PFH31421.1 hypothetical protein BESB_028560 [Besnoitia besnoiti]